MTCEVCERHEKTKVTRLAEQPIWIHPEWVRSIEAEDHLHKNWSWFKATITSQWSPLSQFRFKSYGALQVSHTFCGCPSKAAGKSLPFTVSFHLKQKIHPKVLSTVILELRHLLLLQLLKQTSFLFCNRNTHNPFSFFPFMWRERSEALVPPVHNLRWHCCPNTHSEYTVLAGVNSGRTGTHLSSENQKGN